MWAVMGGFVVLCFSVMLKSQHALLVRSTEGGHTKSNQITVSGSVMYKVSLSVLALQIKLNDVMSGQPATEYCQNFYCLWMFAFLLLLVMRVLSSAPGLYFLSNWVIDR